MHKPPKQSVPGHLPIPFGVVAHFHEVIAAADIRFGRHQSAVGKLTHAIYVGHHHPVISIDKQLHEPAINIIGVKFAE